MKQKLIAAVIVVIGILINFSLAEEIRIENINFSYIDYSLIWEIKNYANEKFLTVDVFFDDKKIYSNTYKLKRDETISDVIYLGGNEEVKSTIGDCRDHVISVKVSYEGKTTEIKKTIKDTRYIDYRVEVSPDPINGDYNYLVNFANETPKFGYGDKIKFFSYDNNGNLIRELEGDVYLKEYDQKMYKKVESGLTVTEEGAIEVQPWKYGIGNYTVIIRQKTPHGEKLYCTKKLNFAVKGKIMIRNLPSSAKIGEDVMLTILAEGLVTQEGKKGGKYYIGIKNLETDEENVLTIGSGLSTIILNSTYFPNPGIYKITAYKDENYWEDSREILIIDKPRLEISVPENVEIGKRIEIKINGKDEPIKNLEVEIISPDNSITIYKKENFFFIPTVYGEYEIIAKSENYASTSKKFRVLEDMFLDIIKTNDDERIKVGDIIEFRIYDKQNKTLYPKIYVNGKEIKTNLYMIKDIKTNVRAELDGYLPIEREIFAYGIIKINISNKSIEYGEKIKISIDSDPKADNFDIKIFNKDTNESINYRGNFYEFIPKAGNYNVLVNNENYITAEENFYVKNAKLKVNVSYEIDYVVIKITHNEVPIEGAKIFIKTPQEKNLTLITDSNGIVKFKTDEGGKYKIYKIEKENFENIEKEIIIDVPSSNIIAMIASVGIIILIIFLTYVIHKVLKKSKKEKIEEKKLKEEKYEYKVYEEGGLIGMQ